MTYEDLAESLSAGRATIARTMKRVIGDGLAERSGSKKLEGFNNRIKVAKRIAYGYRDEDYYFSLIQFISIPYVRAQSHRKT